MGCTQDHKLISNCLDFIDSKAKVSYNGLSPNLCYYLPSLYHYLVNHLKKTHTLNVPQHTNQCYTSKLLNSSDKEKSAPDYLSPDHEPHNGNEGTQNIAPKFVI